MPEVTKNTSERIFYSVKEVAAQFGSSKKSVYRWLDRGLLKASNASRHKMILKSSVDEFVLTTVSSS